MTFFWKARNLTVQPVGRFVKFYTFSAEKKDLENEFQKKDLENEFQLSDSSEIFVEFLFIF